DADVVVGAAAEVRILHPEDEAPALLLGVEPAEERRPDAADVQHAGGRRGETGDDLAGHGASRLKRPVCLNKAGDWRLETGGRSAAALRAAPETRHGAKGAAQE